MPESNIQTETQEAPEVDTLDASVSGTGYVTAANPYKDNSMLYAAGDVIVWAGLPNVGAPTGFEDPSTISAGTYKCLGWVDTSGYIFKLDETIKDIPAAGVLTPIRTILTGGSKTVQCNFLEALNPFTRAMFDNVPIFPTTSSPLKPAASRTDPSCGTTSGSPTVTDTAAAAGDVGKSVSGTGVPAGATILTVTAGVSFTMSVNATATGTASLTIGGLIGSYVIPDPPADNRYGLIFDSIDGAKAMRLYAPFAKVTARGNDQVQQADVEMLDMTFTFYPGTIGAVSNAVAKRYINYGKDVSAYFT
jgi:hypothetical protein